MSTRPPLLPILSINFIGTLGFSIVLPFLVFLVTDWGGNAFIYGLTGATYSVFQLIGAPLLGRWSDRIGRRRVLLVSQAGTLVSWLVFLIAFVLPQTTLVNADSCLTGPFALTLPLVVLILARALDGLTGGNVSVANAYLADISDDDMRAANFGKMAVSSNLGFVAGPAIAGILGATALGAFAPVAAAALISLITTVFIAFGLPESTLCVLTDNPEQTSVRKLFGQEQRDCFEVRSAQPLSARVVLERRGLLATLTMHFLVMLGFNFFYVAFPVFAVVDLGWSLTQTGTFFAVMGLLMAGVQGPVLGWVTTRLSERALIIGGSVLLSGGFWLYDSMTSTEIYLGATLMAAGNGVMWPSVQSMLARVAGKSSQGAIQGFAGSLGAVASILGLLLGGVLYTAIGSSVFLVSTGVTLVVTLIGSMTGGALPPNDERDAQQPVVKVTTPRAEA